MAKSATAKAHEQFEQEVIARAVYFTTFRFAGRGKRDRREFETFELANEDAKDDERALIYAVDDRGFTAHMEKA